MCVGHAGLWITSVIHPEIVGMCFGILKEVYLTCRSSVIVSRTQDISVDGKPQMLYRELQWCRFHSSGQVYKYTPSRARKCVVHDRVSLRLKATGEVQCPRNRDPIGGGAPLGHSVTCEAMRIVSITAV